MATTLVLDDRLLQEAQRVSGSRSNAAAVTEALKEYIHRHKRAELFKAFVPVEFVLKYDVNDVSNDEASCRAEGRAQNATNKRVVTPEVP